MRIFQIGFSKCGTRTIYRFLTQNELSGIHWEKGALALRIYSNLTESRPILDGYDHFNVFTDMEWMGKDFYFEAYKLYPYLYEAYPDAVFILNTRDREAWIRSRLAHGGGSYAARTMKVRGVKTVEALTDIWREDWAHHHQKVMEFFRDKGRFFVFDIEKDGPEVIARHLPEITLDLRKYSHKGKTKPPKDAPTQDVVDSLRAQRKLRREQRKKAEAAGAGAQGQGRSHDVPI